MDPRKVYLFLFNIVSCLGWALILAIWCLCLFYYRYPPEGYWAMVSTPLNIVQGLAIFETIHAMTGIVKSGLWAIVLQLFVRFITLYAVQNQYELAQSHWGLYVVTFAHAFSEIPRYLYFAWKQLGKVPYGLTWVRYSLFVVFYPLGMIGEWSDLLHMLPWFYREKSLALFIFWAIMAVLYIPGFPVLYKHMLRMRKKQLKKFDKEK